MTRRMLGWLTAAILLAAFAGGALARGRAGARGDLLLLPGRGGRAVTKIIDGLAADFKKENPGIKVKPIYAGTYQETIVKVLTALKSGEPPQTSMLLSTDMFTLIDEDAIVPFDAMAKSAEDQAWLKSFFPAFMLNSQTGGKTWGIPFQRSTIVLYWNKEAFKEAGLDPNKPPATWAEQVEYARKLTKRDAGGNVTQWGLRGAVLRLPVLALPGLHHPERRAADEPGRQRDLLRQARGGGGAPVLGGSQRQAQGHGAPASSSGAPRRRTSSRGRPP